MAGLPPRNTFPVRGRSIIPEQQSQWPQWSFYWLAMAGLCLILYSCSNP